MVKSPQLADMLVAPSESVKLQISGKIFSQIEDLLENFAPNLAPSGSATRLCWETSALRSRDSRPALPRSLQINTPLQ